MFRPGDRVFGGAQGSFAERIVVKENALRKVPKGWSIEDAAGIAATAPVSYGALVRLAGLNRGEIVLVHAAAGGLGVMACQIARALGARVVATVGSVKKGEVVRRLGVEDVVLYREEGWEKKVMDLTGGEGVDVVFDPVGLVGKSIRCLKYAGRIVVIGFAGLEGKMENVAINRILLKSAKVFGYVCIALESTDHSLIDVKRYGETGRRFPAETSAIWEGFEDMLQRGVITPVVFDTTYHGLESVPRALQDLAARKVWGKAIVHVAPEQDMPKL